MTNGLNGAPQNDDPQRPSSQGNWLRFLERILTDQSTIADIELLALGRDEEPHNGVVKLVATLSLGEARSLGYAACDYLETLRPEPRHGREIFNLLQVVSYFTSPRAKQLVRHMFLSRAVDALTYEGVGLHSFVLTILGNYSLDRESEVEIMQLIHEASDYRRCLIATRILWRQGRPSSFAALTETLTKTPDHRGLRDLGATLLALSSALGARRLVQYLVDERAAVDLRRNLLTGIGNTWGGLRERPLNASEDPYVILLDCLVAAMQGRLTLAQRRAAAETDGRCATDVIRSTLTLAARLENRKYFLETINTREFGFAHSDILATLLPDGVIATEDGRFEEVGEVEATVLTDGVRSPPGFAALSHS